MASAVRFITWPVAEPLEIRSFWDWMCDAKEGP